MADGPGKLQCQLTCFGAGGLLGLLAAVLLFFVGGFSSAQAIFCGILIALVVGGVAALLFCKPLPKLEDAYAKNRAEASRAGDAPTAAAGAASAAAAAAPASAAAAPASAAAAPDPAPAPGAAASAAASAAAADDGSADAMSGEPHPIGSAALEDETGIASGSPEPVGAAALEDELVEAHADADPAASDAADTGAKAAAESTAASGGEDYDGDGTLEGENEGTRPEALDGPRDGKADNLKEIKGIGPKLEKLCNSMGFYHFDQIANWTPDEVAWVNANLEGFKGRVTRDNWIEQAKILAAGGETEFSKRVEGGDVY